MMGELTSAGIELAGGDQLLVYQLFCMHIYNTHINTYIYYPFPFSVLVNIFISESLKSLNLFLFYFGFCCFFLYACFFLNNLPTPLEMGDKQMIVWRSARYQVKPQVHTCIYPLKEYNSILIADLPKANRRNWCSCWQQK